MKYSEVYNKAADIVEKGWVQGAFAADEFGNEVSISSSKAVGWCMSGALAFVFGDSIRRAFRSEDYENMVCYLKIGDSLSLWNDDQDRTKKEVVVFLRRAAERADKEGKTCG